MAPLTRRTVRILGAILLAAFALRLAHWLAVRNLPFFARLIIDSKEYDAWGQRIAAGDWLGSRVFSQAPLYPYLLGAMDAAIGRHLDAIYLLQIAAAVAGVGALFLAGRAMGGEKAGLAAAALAAAYGPFLFYDVQVLKESLAVTVVCFLLAALAAARKADGPKLWLAAGVLWGVLTLLRENAFLLAPFLLALAYRRGAAARAVLIRAGALSAGFALTLAPVAIRNGVVGGEFLPTTAQGGMNVFIGNNPEADGTFRPIVPGKQIPELERGESTRLAEEAEGRELSPAEVSRYWVRRSWTWAVSDPLAFARLQVRKAGLYWSWYEWPDTVDYYWTRARSPVYRLPLVEFSTISLLFFAGVGVVWRRGLLAAYAPAWTLAAGWMFATTVFFLLSRYRLPGVPALLLVAGAAVAAVDDLRRGGRRSWRVGAAALVAAFLLPIVTTAKPRTDLVEYNLGRLAEDDGDAAAAERHYRAAVEANPENFLACMNLGTLAARRQDWPAALAYYRRAEALEKGSDDVECDLGGVLLATGDAAQAEAHLDRALALNARNLDALQNKAVLLSRRGDYAGARELNRRLLALDPANGPARRMKDRLERAGGGRAP